MEYGYALVKQTLGLIRGKYSTIPIPGDQTTLDGDTLRSESQTMKQRLIQQLKQYLDSVTKSSLIQKQQIQDQVLKQTLGNIPTKIYIA